MPASTRVTNERIAKLIAWEQIFRDESVQETFSEFARTFALNFLLTNLTEVQRQELYGLIEKNAHRNEVMAFITRVYPRFIGEVEHAIQKELAVLGTLRDE